MRRSALKLSLLLLAASTAACVTPSTRPDSLTPTEQFSIEVRPETDRIQLAARTGDLSPAQVQALAALAGRWRDAGSGPVVVEAPAGAQNAAAAFRAASAAARVLGDYGVPPTAVVSTSYDASGRPDGVIQVSFTRPVAVGPDCAAFQSDFVATFENRPIGNFGCANVANFAAQLADPNDLLGPKPMTPADATRRGVVIEKYRAGEPSGTPRSTNPRESANVEEAQR